MKRPSCISFVFFSLTVGHVSFFFFFSNPWLDTLVIHPSIHHIHNTILLRRAGDDPKLAQQARSIYPIRKKGNLLLCTLIVGNVAVNSLLSILTADKFGGTAGFLSSTILIVIFGEIVPQALCQRYSLLVGSLSVPLLRVIILLFFPVTFILAKGLDVVLGKELATTYSNAEMLKLLAIHVREEVMDPDTAAVMGGALRYKSMLVRQVMTTMDKTFMLSAEDKLNFETIARMYVRRIFSFVLRYIVPGISCCNLTIRFTHTSMCAYLVFFLHFPASRRDILESPSTKCPRYVKSAISLSPSCSCSFLTLILLVVSSS
jgi:hypothetical protein